MANTYTQIHIHAVFSVQNRLSLILAWNMMKDMFSLLLNDVTFLRNVIERGGTSFLPSLNP
jgi:hypothetical protein